MEDIELAQQSTGVQEAPQKRDISGATQSVVGGSRSYSEMNRIARLLTPKEKKQLAYYFSQLPFQAGQIKEAEEESAFGKNLAMGKEIVELGNVETGIPACISCHGLQLEGMQKVSPPLAGQPSSYIIKQLDHWQKGHRSNDEGDTMRNIAVKLTDSDKKNIAAYLATLPYRVNHD